MCLSWSSFSWTSALCLLMRTSSSWLSWNISTPPPARLACWAASRSSKIRLVRSLSSPEMTSTRSWNIRNINILPVSALWGFKFFQQEKDVNPFKSSTTHSSRHSPHVKKVHGIFLDFPHFLNDSIGHCTIRESRVCVGSVLYRGR